MAEESAQRDGTSRRTASKYTSYAVCHYQRPFSDSLSNCKCSMFFHLLYIHLFRPFLKYHQANSPLPSNVSPRKICSQAAAMISKLLRLYKRTYGLRQICNIAVYIAHSACTIHLLNLPNKDARRDITHGVRQLEEIAESWTCARRTLVTLAIQVRRWNIDLPSEPASVLARVETKYNHHDQSSSDFGKTSPTIQEAQRATANSSVEPLTLPVKAEIPNDLAEKLSPSESTDSWHSIRSLPNKVQDTVTPSAPPMQRPNQTQEQSPTQGQSQQMQHYPEGWTRGTLQPPMRRQNSPSALFGSLDDLFEDSKDWWLRDQSDMYDHWSRPSVNGTVGNDNALSNLMNGMNGTVNNGATSSRTSPIQSNNVVPNGNSMMNMNGQMRQSGNGNVGNMGQAGNFVAANSGMGYLDFADDTTYAYDNNGTMY